MEPANQVSQKDENATSPIERRSRSSAHLGAIRAIKAAHAGERNWMERIAERMTRVASSPWFFLLHILWFTGWIVWNIGITPLPAFDPYPFGFLTLVVSLEAIFLSIFVLMAQGRESSIAELREMLQPLDSQLIERELVEQSQPAGVKSRNNSDKKS